MARRKSVPDWFEDSKKVRREFEVAKMLKHNKNGYNSKRNFRAVQKR